MNKIIQQESTVYIVEDDIAVSEALTSLLKSISLSVFCFNDPVVFLNAFKTTWKGCLLFDVRMPGMSGLKLYDELKVRKNNLPVIFITGHGDVPAAVRAMKAGAFDFIMKPFNNQDLLDQIQKALSLGSSNPEEIKDNFKELLKTLTPRESEILGYLIEGKFSKEISYDLEISLSTVELHRSSVMHKLKVRNLAELVRKYLTVYPPKEN